jgi:hypothetical protein
MAKIKTHVFEHVHQCSFDPEQQMTMCTVVRASERVAYARSGLQDGKFNSMQLHDACSVSSDCTSNQERYRRAIQRTIEHNGNCTPLPCCKASHSFVIFFFYFVCPRVSCLCQPIMLITAFHALAPSFHVLLLL